MNENYTSTVSVIGNVATLALANATDSTILSSDSTSDYTSTSTVFSTVEDIASTFTSFTEDVTSLYTSLENATDNATTGMAMEPTQFPYHMLGFTAACAFIIAIIGAIGNLLTIVALPMNRALRTTATAFVVNLAVVELLFCVCILPLSGLQYAYLMLYETSLLSDDACIFFTFTRYTLAQVEIQTILAIALMRAVAVSCMKLYSFINRPKVVGVYIAILWIYAISLRIPIAMKVWGHFRFNSITMECDMGIDPESIAARKVLLWLEGVGPVLVIVALYIFIFAMLIRRCVLRIKRLRAKRRAFYDAQNNVLVVRKSSNRVAQSVKKRKRSANASLSEASDDDQHARDNEVNMNPDECSSPRKLSTASFRSLKRMVSETNFRQTFARRSSSISQKLSTNRRDMRVARTIFIIFLVLMVCSVPVLLVHIFDYSVVYKRRFLAMHILYWVQYCVNAFIYVLMNRQYRDAYANLLSKMFPSWQKHQKFRFPWEAASEAPKPVAQHERNNSTRSQKGASTKETQSSPPTESLDVTNHQSYNYRSGRLSAIPETGSIVSASEENQQDPLLASVNEEPSTERNMKQQNSFNPKQNSSKFQFPDIEEKNTDSLEDSETRIVGKIEIEDGDDVSVSSATHLNQSVANDVDEKPKIDEKASQNTDAVVTFTNLDGVSMTPPTHVTAI